jgi:(1->4)-alpha-D-glucan 1-alpha-D-glucosylmutase
MEKATREAKVHTSWVNPNEEYDAAIQNFVNRVLDDKGKNAFLKDLIAFHKRVSFYGQFNSLSQTLLKLTSPGVPDIYQGTELWDFSMVDPDNRRPVDYQLRSWLLTGLKRRVAQADSNLVPLTRELLDDTFDGRIKLYLIYRTLNFRQEHAEVFTDGAYHPLEGVGEKRDHLCAFARTLMPTGESQGKPQEVIVAVPRLVLTLSGGNGGELQSPLGTKVWKDTWLVLPQAEVGQTYTNLLTGEEIATENHLEIVGLPMASVCAHFPVALLVRK